MFVTMATTKKCIKVVFYTNKDGGNNNILGKLSRTTVVSITIKSYNQPNLLNLVTMATAKNRKKAILMTIKKVVENILVLGKF